MNVLPILLSCGGQAPIVDVELGGTLGDWAAADLSCETAGECFPGEVCVEGTCQVERCSTDLQASVPPMGEGLTFLQENEIAFADTQSQKNNYWFDLYQPEATDPKDDTYDYSVPVGPDRIIDVTGGNFDGTRSETYAIAVQDSTVISVPQLKLEVDSTLDPEAIASGDVDGDGLDEIVVIARTGSLAICHLDEGVCDQWTLDGSGQQRDVAVADIDGDSFEEPILLLDIGDSAYLFAFHPNADVTGEKLDYYARVDDDYLFRITAGDVDGDLQAEVIGLKDPSWYCLWCDDELHLYDSTVDGQWAKRYSSSIDGKDEVKDIAAGDIDQDDIVEIATISGGGGFTLEQPLANSFQRRESSALSRTQSPDRVAMADHDGNAPRATLMDGPARVDGAIVPIIAMVLPPYHRDFSGGVSTIAYGDTESVSETMTDTVSLGVSADVGTSPSFFGLFGTSLSAKVDQSVSNSVGTTNSYAIGGRYLMSADPNTFGPNYGGVVIGWGCFDAYLYEVDDPEGLLDDDGATADGEPLVVTVPVGGGQALYSTTRYNAMAETLGLPPIDIPYTVGDPTSYPAEPERLDGSPIPEEDMLFPSLEPFVVSDVGTVAWWNTVGETVSNTESLSTSVGASAKVTAFGVTVGVGVTDGWGESYSVNVGTSAAFLGSLPPIPDNPGTPEDEYAQHQYTATPWVYQQEYTDALGNVGYYWVMTSSVGE